MSEQIHVLWNNYRNNYKYLTVSDWDKKLIKPAKEKYSIKLSSQAIKPEMSIPTFNKGKCKNIIKLKSM